ncbi:MAG: class II aldolase/adducin family protein [Planctomycetes bacterium]|nr:class II aldolase/adducin family protein [Planctomycetota bacterium]
MSVQEMAERFGWSDEEARLRNAICEIGSLCYQRSYIVGADGNISGRLSDGTMIITPAGAMKGFLSPRNLAHVDMRGESVDDGPKCSSEVGIHIVSYEERPEMKAVLHCHPPHCVAMTVAGIDLQVPIIPEIVVTIGGIPPPPNPPPPTHAPPPAHPAVVRGADTLVMKNHGSVTVGTNLLDAYKKLDMIEHTARILWLAHAVRGGIDPLPDEAVQKLLETRNALGLSTLNTLENQCGFDEKG